jgi:hypothetical protein
MTKDRAKALVAAGLRRSSCTRGLHRLAKVGGCSKRTLEKAQSEVSLPSFEVLLNMLDEDPTILDEAFRAKGWQLVPVTFDAKIDAFETLGAMCAASGTLGQGLADGSFDHVDALEAAPLISRSLPGQLAILRRAAELRGAA